MSLHQNPALNQIIAQAPLMRAALTYANRNLATFPCRPRSKDPATSHGCNDATTDLDTVLRWWSRAPDCNIGVATGAISGIFVLDVDGVDGEGELHKLENELGALPNTVESVTGKGRHLFFRHPDRTVRNSVKKLGDGLDIRGDGGYIIAPPSVHPSGRAYCWSVDSAKAFATAPAWLLDKVCEPAGKTKVSIASAPADWCSLIHDGVDEGGRNANVTRVVGHLLRKRIDPEVVLELAYAFNEARCRPPLPIEDIITIVDSIAGRELARRGVT